jgi:hypothetical protein
MTNPAMIRPVRSLARGATFVAAFSLTFVGAAQAHRSHVHVRTHAPRPAEAHVARGLRVSVQPIAGELGPAVRSEIARLLRGRGCRVSTTLAAVSGTGQYPELARDNHVAAFVSTDLAEGAHRDLVTFLVWDGASGSVLGRWSASAAPKDLGKAIAKGFWKNLGPRFEAAQPPPSDNLEEAAPMYVNAGEPLR